MSKLARIVAPVAMAVVMSLGSAAHAQESGSSSQQAGTVEPGATAAQDPTSGSATASSPPVVHAIPVTVSWGTGRVGKMVKVSADVRGCTRPGSVKGEFRDRMGAVRPLSDQLVAGSSRFTALFVVNSRDAVGQGRFRVVCDVGLPTATQGYASFWVLPEPGPIVVTVSPAAGGPGTVVKVTAEVRGGCDPVWTFFKDSKANSTEATHPTLLSFNGHRVVARYTVTSKDAVGRGRFGVSCDATTDTYRTAYASFWVRAAGGAGGPGKPASGGVTVNRSNGRIRLPSKIDTGLGGTADGAGQGRDPAWLLLPAGLLLVTVAVGLHVRQAGRRRQ
jgi:hypothetical protein